MSSDKLASIKEPVVALDFDVVESGKDRTVSVELKKEELDSLISSLEAANKVNIQHLMIPQEMSVTNNSSLQNYAHPDNHTIRSTVLNLLVEDIQPDYLA